MFPAPPDSCKVVHELRAAPSKPDTPTQVVDELPGQLAEGKPRLMAYRVTLLNQKGRSAGPSAPVYALAGAAPAAAGPIEITPRRNGALIRWQATNQPPAAPMQVTRTLVANAAGPVVPKKAKASGKPAARPAAPMNPSTAPTLQQVTLTPEGERDQGGMVDHGVHDGDTVRYVAQRVLMVELTPPPAMVAGKRGRMTESRPLAQVFELKSEPSPAVTFTFHDVIPPDAPVGLASVTGGGFGEAPSIDLSWEANFVRVNGELVTGPEFRDTTAGAGKTYVYRVTAVDQHHNESAPSATVKAEIRR
jgi:hypothetical protein